MRSSSLFVPASRAGARLRGMSVDRGPSKRIPLDPSPGATTDGLPRRTALQALLGGLGTGFALPSVAAAQHPMHQHLANPAVLEQAQQNAIAASTPVFLDAHQAKTLEALAEAIVPGSTKARVAPFLDQLLAVESAANQRAFLGALGAFDMAAISTHGKAWIAITPPEQDALLRGASAADERTSGMRSHFQNLKDWIAGAYYSSETGMRELGWDGNVFHPELPGCTHPGGHLE
jgi:gluconate 2-dehydrogenase subunit 3-like protein